MEHIYSHELIEQFKSGKKEFREIALHFSELDNMNLPGIVFIDSKIEYSRFWFANLKGAKFINCDIYFSGFYCANLEDVVFDDCTIDMTRFDGATVKDTRVINSRLSYCLLTNINLGELDFHGSSKFKIITDPEAITNEEILDALKIIGNRSGDLPIEIKSVIQKRIETMLKNFNKDTKVSLSPDQKTYGSSVKASNLYQAMNSFADELIKYGNSEAYKSSFAPYKSRKPYGKE